MRIAATLILFGLLVASTHAEDEDILVLMLGNSHSSESGLPKVLETLLTNDESHSTADVTASRRWKFLSDRLGDGNSQRLLESREWTHVILQAQKYSTSGKYYYPTDAAEEWIRRVRSLSALPILFPEWARKNNNDEGMRIHQLHLAIASREAACVAPVGIAWALVIKVDPEIRLHDSDGNHANRNGAHLTAYVLYQAISGRRADSLPDIDDLKIKPEAQELFRSAASRAFELSPACHT